MKLLSYLKDIFMFKRLFKSPLFILSIILLIGIFFRLFNILDNITFGYDQARDAQRILDIVTFKNLKILGQESDIPGVFHGVLTYYFLTPVYFIGGFNPNFPAVFLSLINLSGIILLYLASIVIFKSQKIGLIAGLFWALSYEQANFSRFISNASAMSIATTILFLGLAIFIFKKKDWGLIISVIGFALSVQFNFSQIYLILVYPLLFFIFRPKLNKKIITYCFIILFLLLSSFLLAEVKYNFNTTKSLISYLTYHRGGFDFFANGSRYISRTYETIYYSFLTLNKTILFLSFIAISILGLRLIKNKKIIVFLYIWLFSNLPLFLFNSGVLETQIVNSVFFAPLTLLIAYCLSKINIKRKFYLAVFIVSLLAVALSNINLFYKDNFKEIRILSTQNITLKDEKRLIDYTYQSSKEKEFSICALTNPLYANILWSYLYNWYGKNKYGYTPYWAGQEQTNSPNNLFYDKEHVSQRYIILEPSIGIGGYAKKVFIYMEDHTSTLKEEKQFGDLIVQKRTLNTDLSKFTDSQKLTAKEIKSIKSIIKDNPRFTCYTTYTKAI